MNQEPGVVEAQFAGTAYVPDERKRLKPDGRLEIYNTLTGCFFKLDDRNSAKYFRTNQLLAFSAYDTVDQEHPQRQGLATVLSVDREHGVVETYEPIRSACPALLAGDYVYIVDQLKEPKPGDKYDQGKARYDLLPFKALEEIVLVLTFGANKYKADGWREVENWRWRYFAAAMRHLVAWFWKREKRDPESGLHHLAHAACCIMFMLELDDA